MKPYLVFIDDDQAELDSLGKIVSEEFEYLPIKWPFEEPIRISRKPDLIVLDLYFPGKDAPLNINSRALKIQKAEADKISDSFRDLYKDENIDGASLLRHTFSAIQQGYELLWMQCKELGQSADVGRSLLARIRANEEYSDIPVVFYSRKATVEEAERALQAGAFAVIPKVSSQITRVEREAVLTRLKLAISDFKRLWSQNKSGKFPIDININVTLFKQEFTAQKLEFVVAKVGG